MTLSRLLTFLAILSPVVAPAQEGIVLYDRAVQYDFELPPRAEHLRDQIPSQSVTHMVLLFDESGSLMKEAPDAGDEADVAPRAMGLVTRLKMGSASRSDHETLLAAYVSLEDGTVAEAWDFMGRTFLITGTQPAYAWKLTGQQSEFLGRTTHRATTVHDSSSIEAWFSPEIPVPAGPGSYGGLPGLILVVSVDDGHLVYSATEIALKELEEGAVRPPEEGRQVSREEYEEIVTEKLEERRQMIETRKQRRRRGDGRR